MVDNYPVAISGNRGAQGSPPLYYSVGGFAGTTLTGTSYLYDANANNWSPISSLPAPLYNVAVGYAGEFNDLFAFGGADSSSITTTVSRCDAPCTGGWFPAVPLPARRSGMYIGTSLSENSFFLVGGASDFSSPMPTNHNNQTWEYDGSTYITMTNMPGPGANGAYAQLGSLLYIFGGELDTNGTAGNFAYRYDTVSNTWITLPNMPQTRKGSGASVVGSKIWIYGGVVDGVGSSNTTIFDPATNTYSPGPSLTNFRTGFASGNVVRDVGGVPVTYSIAVGGNGTFADGGGGSPGSTELSLIGGCPSPTPTITATATPTSTPISTLVNFEVRLYENSAQQQFDIIYGQVDGSGNSATVRVQRADGSNGQFTQYTCNGSPNLLTPGLRLTFTRGCGLPQPPRTQYNEGGGAGSGPGVGPGDGSWIIGLDALGVIFISLLAATGAAIAFFALRPPRGIIESQAAIAKSVSRPPPRTPGAGSIPTRVARRK